MANTGSDIFCSEKIQNSACISDGHSFSVERFCSLRNFVDKKDVSRSLKGRKNSLNQQRAGDWGIHLSERVSEDEDSFASGLCRLEDVFIWTGSPNSLTIHMGDASI